MQHMVITLVQSSFNYAQYPTDTQVVYMRMYSFSLFATQISFSPVTVDYQYAESGEYSIELNPVWNFKSAYGYGGSQDPGTYYAPRTYAVIVMEFSRIPGGIINRLAVPMFFLVILAALAFWADTSDRVNSTVTMLLAISALYIVVIQNIPPIGYLTNFDYFVTVMFVVLFACCILHLLTVRLAKDTKLEKWPIRKFYIRLLEFFGRVTIIPLTTTFYLYYFRLAEDAATIYASSFVIGLFIFLVSVREFFSTRSAFEAAMENIKSKADDLSDVSTMEVILFNLYTYRILAHTLRHHVRILSMQQRVAKSQHSIKHDSTTMIAPSDIELTSIVSPFALHDEQKV
jgi:hypothetical protein